MLILPAAPAGAVSGKQDDSIVYFRWRGNQAARSFATPANPQTTNQTAVRNALTILSKSWADLTDSEREGWNTYAATYLSKDRFGRDVTTTGLNWYIKANSNRLYMGLAAVDTAPTDAPPAPFVLSAFDITAGGGEASVAIAGTPPAGFKMKVLVEVTPTVAWTPSIRRSRFINGVNSSSYITIANTADQTLIASPNLSWGAGNLVAVWYIVVRVADGTESTPTLYSMVAPA